MSVSFNQFWFFVLAGIVSGVASQWIINKWVK